MTMIAQLDPAELRDLRRRLFHFARFRLPSAEAAEDVVQDVLESMLCQASPYQGRSQYAVWAIGILRHKIADYYRHPSRRELPHGHVGTAPAEDGGEATWGQGPLAPWLRESGDALLDHPEKCFEMTELCEQVEASLARQPPQQAWAFVLRAVHDLTTAEIAARLGLKKGHCDVLVLRARRALSQELGSLPGHAGIAGPRDRQRAPARARAALKSASA